MNMSGFKNFFLTITHYIEDKYCETNLPTTNLLLPSFVPET